jgi:urocanate hydratase
LFPSHKEAPRVVTNGMVIPNYSKPDDWEKWMPYHNTAMTAGLYMYIGPQGTWHITQCKCVS